MRVAALRACRDIPIICATLNFDNITRIMRLGGNKFAAGKSPTITITGHCARVTLGRICIIVDCPNDDYSTPVDKCILIDIASK